MRLDTVVWVDVEGIMVFLILNIRRVLCVVCFLLGNSLVSEFYMPTFRNTLFHIHRQVGAPTCLWIWNRQSVPKRQHIKFRSRGITQKKTYNKSWFDSQPVLVFSQFQSPVRLWVPQMVKRRIVVQILATTRGFFVFSQVLWLALGPSQILI